MRAVPPTALPVGVFWRWVIKAALTRRRVSGPNRFGAIALCLLLAACASGARPGSTRLTIGDMTEIADRTAQALAASPFLAGRTADSAPVVIAITRVENNTSDVITRSEQWYLMQAVANQVFDLFRDRNVTMVVPAERLALARRRGAIEARAGQTREPTHVMTARFTTVTRSDAGGRRELYQADYQITKISTGEVVWADSVEFTRGALGRSYN